MKCYIRFNERQKNNTHIRVYTHTQILYMCVCACARLCVCVHRVIGVGMSMGIEWQTKMNELKQKQNVSPHFSFILTHTRACAHTPFNSFSLSH